MTLEHVWDALAELAHDQIEAKTEVARVGISYDRRDHVEEEPELVESRYMEDGDASWEMYSWDEADSRYMRSPDYRETSHAVLERDRLEYMLLCLPLREA